MHTNVAQDIGAWAANVGTSVFIVFVNKVLMDSKGYGFHYAVTLSGLHYLCCSFFTWTMQGLKYISRVQLPFRDLVIFTATADVSIASLNLSLMVNPVGIYQVAKLLVIPFVYTVEVIWYGRRATWDTTLAVATVIAGVGIVTVSEFTVTGNVIGLSLAATSVVASGMQQILCRSMQLKHNLASHELLANVAPAQALTLLLMGTFIDAQFHEVSFDSLRSWAACAVLALSCLLAVGVNLSQFLCLGRFSALSFQVLGHTKTILVLIGGVLLLGDNLSHRQLLGMVIAVLGMIGYSVVASRPAPKAEEKVVVKGADEEEAPLMRNSKHGTETMRTPKHADAIKTAFNVGGKSTTDSKSST